MFGIFMKFLLSVGLLLLLTSCSADILIQPPTPTMTQQAEKNLKYFQDSRTQLCYGYIPTYGFSGLSNVPCSEDVLKAIQQDKNSAN